ncbi:hypothetical protein [Saccharopolyspora sp. 6V]|uniref:hypothetical protein n=1 Tax=Saccharopolyspora sp. 6V TaxID=2877239 RepID=UPI001CD68551|nr:hypothetical protein [Saccharopolyspora sp. 6V]MCA1191618.1 hypothetical protein [Saccharopolyspora sp. 6V]
MATYKPNRAGMARYLKSAELRNALRRRAQDGVKFARSIAPRDSGDYARQIRVDVGRDILKGDRAAAFIVASARHSTVIEIGRRGARARGNRGHRVLARTLDYLNSGGA